jgi:hypothetical protein
LFAFLYVYNEEFKRESIMQTVVHRANNVSSRSGLIAVAAFLVSVLFILFTMPRFSEAARGDGAEALLQGVPGAHRATGNLTEPGAAKWPGQSRRAHRNSRLSMDAAPAASLAEKVAPTPNRRKMNRGDTRTILGVVAPAKPGVNQISRKRSRDRTTR